MSSKGPLLAGILVLAAILGAAGLASGFVQFNDVAGARIQIAASRASTTDFSSDVYVSSTGTILTAYPNGATTCYVAVSTTNGATWTETSISGNSWCLMVKKSDTEYLAFNGVTGIYRTTDTGNTWSLYGSIVDTCVGAPSKHWSFEVNHADTTKVMLIWSGGTNALDDLCSSTSLDGGATWSATVIVATSGGGSSSQSGLFSAAGSTWVAYWPINSNCSAVYRTTDNGATWAPTTLVPLCGNVNGVSKHGVYGAAGSLGFFTISESSTPNRINYIASADGGLTWGTATILSYATDADISISPSAIPSYYDAANGALYAGIYYQGDGDPLPAAQQMYVYRYQSASGTVVAQSYPTVITNAGIGVTATGSLVAVGKQTSGTLNQYYYPGQALLTPTTPAGLSAIVASSGNVELRWPVSSNDPDQIQGDFDYRIYVESVSVGLDSVTIADGDGIRFTNLAVTAAPLSYKVRAEYTTQGTVSGFTCSVSVDASVVGDTDTCDDPGAAGAIGTGGLEFTTPTDTAAGLHDFCADLMGDSDGSLFLCGLILVVGAYLALAAAFGALGGKGMPALIAGSVAGLGVAVFNIIAEVWGLVFGIVLIVIAASIVLWFARKLTATGGGAASG